MTEEQLLKVLAIAVSIIAAGGGLIVAMLAWYLKAQYEDIKATKKEMSEITRNYLSRFTSVETKILDFEKKMMEYFEELRGVLNDHFQTRHAEVVQEIALIQNQLTENVRRNNDAATEFYKKYAATLDWAHEQSKRRKENVQ